jgi:hypothetical protein
MQITQIMERYWHRLLAIQPYGVSPKGPLYRNHTFVVNLELLHLWKF